MRDSTALRLGLLVCTKEAVTQREEAGVWEMSSTQAVPWQGPAVITTSTLPAPLQLQQAEGAGALLDPSETPPCKNTHHPVGSSRGWSLFLPQLEAGGSGRLFQPLRGLQLHRDHTSATRREGRTWEEGAVQAPLTCPPARIKD